MLAEKRPSTFGPATTTATTSAPMACMYYIHPTGKGALAPVSNLADWPLRAAGPGGVAGASTVLGGGGGAPTSASTSSFKLWSKSHRKRTALDDSGGGRGNGDATISILNVKNGDDNDNSRGIVLGGKYNTMSDINNALFRGGAVSSPPIADGKGLGIVAVVDAAPMSDCGVMTASLGGQSGGANKEDEVSTLARALDRPGEGFPYTLVQLSTRCVRVRVRK